MIGVDQEFNGDENDEIEIDGDIVNRFDDVFGDGDDNDGKKLILQPKRTFDFIFEINEFIMTNLLCEMIASKMRSILYKTHSLYKR